MSIRSYNNEPTNYITDFEIMGNDEQIKRRGQRIQNGQQSRQLRNKNRVRLDMVLAANWNVNGNMNRQNQAYELNSFAGQSSSFQQSSVSSYEESLL